MCRCESPHPSVSTLDACQIGRRVCRGRQVIECVDVEDPVIRQALQASNQLHLLYLAEASHSADRKATEISPPMLEARLGADAPDGVLQCTVYQSSAGLTDVAA